MHHLGVAGKDLYFLNVLRRRMEYPELKRAVREQCQAFDANVVLIPTDRRFAARASRIAIGNCTKIRHPAVVMTA